MSSNHIYLQPKRSVIGASVIVSTMISIAAFSAYTLIESSLYTEITSDQYYELATLSSNHDIEFEIKEAMQDNIVTTREYQTIKQSIERKRLKEAKEEAVGEFIE